MPSEFDTVIDRGGTHAFKWEFRRHCRERDIIPLWVADMDFEAPEGVRRAVRERAAHGVYGYTLLPESYYQAAISWMRRRFGWEIHKKWIVFTPGVVPALNFAVQAFTEPGDRVIVQPPVYYPFFLAVENNGRELVHNPLRLENGRCGMDLDHLRTVIDGRTRLLILCSPHNPTGRVWGEEELKGLAEVCTEHDLIIVSDEIHADLVSPGRTHTPLATLLPEMADRIVTCTSPNKTFNIAGLQTANTIIPDKRLRQRFQQAVHSAGIELANVFGVVALEAAYTTGGEAWLARLLDYLWGNFSLLQEFAADRIPDLGIFPLEGTYLAWLDCRGLHPNDKKLKDHLLGHGVWLDEGSKFGPGGEGFLRLNIACPRTLLEKALERMATAFSSPIT
jgi:cystathionine beta-lyase